MMMMTYPPVQCYDIYSVNLIFIGPYMIYWIHVIEQEIHEDGVTFLQTPNTESQEGSTEHLKSLSASVFRRLVFFSLAQIVCGR